MQFPECWSEEDPSFLSRSCSYR
ncbi:unnamed protein product [Linum tenue]|uniref:Uncharacterized protein n=1 Tax=Linum tenue TaxID=586396 RepID=A0AAV0RJ50_9ROSI|nr:unnamed protein product [Linum tenue]